MEILDPYLYPEDGGGLGDDDDLFAASPREGGADTPLGTPAAVALAERFIHDIREKLDSLEKMLTKTSSLGAEDVERLLLHSQRPRAAQGKVLEGVFDGEQMMGSDGKQYVVPANYASKSKLVEGDILKLTITDDGSFLYKQIGPIDRARVIGTLARDEVTGDYVVLADGKKWNILLASVTYYRAEPGDDLVVLVPKAAPSRWAAVENVIKKSMVLEESAERIKKVKR